jgi:hypothetical protein
MSYARDAKQRLTREEAEESVNDAVADLDRSGEIFIAPPMSLDPTPR